jgi:hypothetical protein
MVDGAASATEMDAVPVAPPDGAATAGHVAGTKGERRPKQAHQRNSRAHSDTVERDVPTL